MAIAPAKSSHATQQLTQTAAATAKAKTKAPVPAKAPAPAAVVSIGRATPQSPSYNAAAAKSKAAPAAAPAPTTPAFVTGTGAVVVDIQSSESGYDNKIYWTSDNWKTRNYLGVDNQTASYNLGTFKAGTKIEFGIDNGNGDFFKSGGASANADNFEHARVTTAADGGMTVGFEDLRGGGDRDFNDAIIGVRSLPQAPVVEKPAPVVQKPAPVVQKPAPVVEKPAPVVQKPKADNRSGLGDGTNPGQGNGRVNSPNVGTDNPNKAGSKPTPAKSTSKLQATR